MDANAEPEYTISLRIRHVAGSSPPLFEVATPTFNNAATGPIPVVDAMSSPHIQLSSPSLKLIRFAMQLPHLIEEQVAAFGCSVEHVAAAQPPTSPRSASHPMTPGRGSLPPMDRDARMTSPGMGGGSQAGYMSELAAGVKRRSSVDALPPDAKRLRPDDPRSPIDQRQQQHDDDAPSGPPVVYVVKNLPDNPEYRDRLVDFFQWAGISVTFCRWNRDPEDTQYMLPFAFFETYDPTLNHVGRVRILRDRRFYGKALRLFTPAEEIDIREDHFKALERAAKYSEDIYDEEERRRPRDRFHTGAMAGPYDRAPPSPPRVLDTHITRFRIFNIPASRTYGQTLRGLFSQAGEVLNMHWELPDSRMERTASAVLEVVKNIHSSRRMLGLRGVVLDGRAIDVDPLDAIDPADVPAKPPAVFIVTNIPPTGPRVGLLRQVFSAKGYVHYVDWHYRRSDRQCFAYISMADDMTLQAEDLEGYDFHGSALRVQRIPNMDEFLARPALLEECIRGNSLERALAAPRGAFEGARPGGAFGLGGASAGKPLMRSSSSSLSASATGSGAGAAASGPPKANPWLPSSWAMGDPLKAAGKKEGDTASAAGDDASGAGSMATASASGTGGDANADSSANGEDTTGGAQEEQAGQADSGAGAEDHVMDDEEGAIDPAAADPDEDGAHADDDGDVTMDEASDAPAADSSAPPPGAGSEQPLEQPAGAAAPVTRSPPDPNTIAAQRLKYVVFRDIPVSVSEDDVSASVVNYGCDACAHAFRDGDNVVLMYDELQSSFMVAAMGALQFGGRMVKGELATAEYLVQLYMGGLVDF